ncbi:MAG: helix-turn-helix domain-containing protein, partial [Anaerolineales bacterium]
MPDTSISIALERFTTFGDLLKYLRRRTGLTQRELSIAVGYSDAQISRLEQNERLPDLATLTARFLPVLMLEDHPEAAERLLDLAASMRREDAPATGLPPYKGLYFFDEADSELFFGREELTASLVERLETGLESGHRFLAVIGASGSGKSSLVRAGLIPALQWRRKSSGWPVFVLTPATHPLEALGQAIYKPGMPGVSGQELAHVFTEDSRGLDQALTRTANASGAEYTLLVIDQFEELFTLCRSETEQSAFIENVLKAAFQPDGKAIILIAMRADFYAHCARFDSLRQALAHHQEYIGPMNVEELRQVIEKPARHGHWEIEPGLVDLMLHDIGADTGHVPEPGALPLLSHALLETWQHRRGRMLTLSGYTASGGVRGAIAETAEAVFHDQLEPQQRDIARQIFLRLTEMGADDNTADTRRRVSFDELVSTNEDRDVIQQVLLTLANARLITTEQDAVEVAHEALIREWPTLRNWLEEDRESLRLHRHLTQAAQEWGNTDRDPSGLYRGARLAQALEWAESHVEELNLLENAFLEASHELAEKEIKEREAQRQRELDAAKKIADEQARAAKLQRSRALWLTGAFVIAIGLAVFAFISRFNAQREAAVNRSLVLAGLAVEAQESGEVDKALALGLEAVDINEPPLDAVSKLVSVANDMGTYAVLTGHTGEVRAGAFGPDSSQVISGGCLNPDTAGNCSSGEMILWDLSTRTDIARWPGHAGWVTALAWTPDGHNVLSGGDDGRLILWDASRQDMLEKWDFQKGGINEIAVSPGENVIGVAHQDGSATLLNLSNRQIVFNLQGHSKPVLDISFSPDGKLVLTSSEDNTMILWDVASGEEVRTFLGHTASVCGAVFLPDGKHILSSSSDMTHRLWDVETGEELQRRESGDTPDGMVLTPDGKTVLHRVGHIIYTWDLESFTGPHKRLLGHVGNLLNLAISSDGRFALSTGEDGTVRIWNLRGSDEFEQIELGFSATSMAVAPDGKSAAIGGWGEYAILWDLNYSKPVDHLPGITGIVAPGAMTFSPDGNWIAAASGDYDQGTENASLIVWNASTGEIHCDLQGHARRVRTVAFSPDSRFVLSG